MSSSSPDTTESASGQAIITWDRVCILALLLAALFGRLWDLSVLPPPIKHDEAYNGLDAIAITERKEFPIYHEGWELYQEQVRGDRPVDLTNWPIFFEGNYGREPLFVYLSALSITILGPTVTALRIVSALAGTIAVFAVYVLAGELVTANAFASPRHHKIFRLSAAFTLAFMYPLLVFSRVGERIILFVPIEIATVYFFWKGINILEARGDVDVGKALLTYFPIPASRTTARWFVLAGISLGAGLYIYAAGRFLPLLFAAFVIYLFIADKPYFWRYWGNLALMAVTAVVVSVPLLVYALSHDYFFVFRSKVIGNRGESTYPGQPLKTWLNNVGRVFRGFLWRGDEQLSNNLPGRPFLDPIQILLVVAGSVGLVVRRQGKRVVFLALWTFVMIAPGILSGDAPHFGRMIGAAAPLSLIVAYGVIWILTRVEQAIRWRGTMRGMLPLLIFMLLVLSTYLSMKDYFGKYAADAELEEVFDHSDWELGRYAAQLSEDSITYLSPTQEDMATIYYALEGDRERIRSFTNPDNLIPAGQIGQTVYYLLRPSASKSVATIQGYFPTAEVEAVEEDLTVVRLQPSSRGLTLVESDPISWEGAITLRGWSAIQHNNELIVTLRWQANIAMQRSYTAYVHLLSQDGMLIAQLDRQPEGYPTVDWQPGEIVIDSFRITLPENFTAGAYVLQTGFYHLPSDERLGIPERIGEVVLTVGQ